MYGTLAWQGYLDHILAAFSRRPPAQLDAPVRTLLRLALFQIARLSKVPPFAAVDTAVELAKRFRSGAAAGLVNAVLRRAVTAWQDVAFPSPEADPVAYLSSYLSHPPWLVESWLAQLGPEDAAALMRANNEPAPTVVRVNRLRTEPGALRDQLRRAGRDAEVAVYSPVALRLDGGGVEALPAYKAGLLSLQGEASQLVSFLVDPRPGERVLDTCAAPGGKATHLAELMQDQGEIVALDINARGVERLRHTARRLGLRCLHSAIADALTWEPTGSAHFDRVLVDAPCSGLGTLRAHPEIKWRRTPADVVARADLQRSLLRRAAAWVRPGGVLVYATCTISVQENDDVLAEFLRDRPAFTLEDACAWVPSSARGVVGGDGMLRTFPHRHGLDGFFAVRLKAPE